MQQMTYWTWRIGLVQTFPEGVRVFYLVHGAITAVEPHTKMQPLHTSTPGPSRQHNLQCSEQKKKLSFLHHPLSDIQCV